MFNIHEKFVYLKLLIKLPGIDMGAVQVIVKTYLISTHVSLRLKQARYVINTARFAKGCLF